MQYLRLRWSRWRSSGLPRRQRWSSLVRPESWCVRCSERQLYLGLGRQICLGPWRGCSAISPVEPPARFRPGANVRFGRGSSGLFSWQAPYWLAQSPAMRFTPQHLFHWCQCTQSSWVLSTLEYGYRLQFYAKPRGIVPTVLRDAAERQSLSGEISALLEKGAVTLLPSEEMGQGFYSTFFLIPKRDGGLRPILNLKGFNRFLKRLPFRMLSLSHLLLSVRRGDWFTTVDLRDAYFHIPIHREHRKYLRFHFQGKAYEHKVLPFGLLLAPRTFTKCMDAALAPLRRQGVRIASYLDDWLICAPSERQVRRDTEVVLAHLRRLGLNREKSCLIPSRTVTYLGLVLDSNVMRASLTPKRLSVLREHLSRFSVMKQVTMKFGRRLLGLLAAGTQAVPLGLLHMRPLQQWFARHRVSPLEDGRRLLPSGPDCQAAVAWWLTTPGLQGGVPMGPVCSRVTISTDASMRGWGAVCQGCSAQGLWRPSWRGVHVNLLELEAVRRALMYFLPVSRGKPVLIRTDNSAVVSYINRQGVCALGRFTTELAGFFCRGVSLRAVYLPGKDNVAADLLSRGGPLPGEWRLHPVIVQAIWDRFGRAQVDLFASQETTHCPWWYSMIGPKGTLGVDGPRPFCTLFPPSLFCQRCWPQWGCCRPECFWWPRTGLISPGWQS